MGGNSIYHKMGLNLSQMNITAMIYHNTQLPCRKFIANTEIVNNTK